MTKYGDLSYSGGAPVVANDKVVGRQKGVDVILRK